MVTHCMICRDKNDDFYHKRREGGGQRVIIEIIISENDDNDGRPLTLTYQKCLQCISKGSSNIRYGFTNLNNVWIRVRVGGFTETLREMKNPYIPKYHIDSVFHHIVHSF